MLHYVYCLIPEKKINWTYTGYTISPKQRLRNHNEGLSKSTKPYRPFKMIIIGEFDNSNEALKFEKDMKRRGCTKRRLVKESTKIIYG